MTTLAPPAAQQDRKRIELEEFGKLKDSELKGLIPEHLVDSWGVDIGASHGCPNGCKFCFLQCSGQPLEFNTPFKTTAEVSACIDKGYELGKRLFVFTSQPEIDIFTSPYIYEIIEYGMNTYPDAVFMMITNGVLIQRQYLSLFKGHRNILFQLSVHTLNEDLRNHIANISNRELIVDLIRDMNGVVMISPFYDLEVFKQDIRDIRDAGFSGLMVNRRIGYTRYSNPIGKAMGISSGKLYVPSLEYAYQTDSQIGACPNIPIFEIKSPKNRYYSELKLLVKTVMNRISGLRGKILFLTSEAAHEWWKLELEHLENVTVGVMKCSTYGGSVDCAGLLVRQDLYDAVAKYSDGSFQYLILPGQMRTAYIPNQVIIGVHPIDTYSDLKEVDGMEVIFIGTPGRLI